LRLAGKTFTQIAAEMGVSEQRAHAIVSEELARINAERSEQAEAVRQLELQRLDALLSAVWEKAKQGDVAAVDRVLAIQGGGARLLGLDAPTKTAFTDRTGKTAATFTKTAAELSDDDLASIAAGGGAGTPAPPESA